MYHGHLGSCFAIIPDSLFLIITQRQYDELAALNREGDSLNSKEERHAQLSRRQCLASLFAAGGALCRETTTHAVNAYQFPRITGMGLVIYVANIRRKWLKSQWSKYDLFEPFTFLKYCQELGAGGMQAQLGSLGEQEANKLREYAAENQLFIDAIIKPPKNRSDLDRFENEIRTAKQVGALAARTTIIPGRRYERFKSYKEFKSAESVGKEMLQRAKPILEKYRVPFAIENHKDQRLTERVQLLKEMKSPFIGVCLDTGNSFALLDDPYETVEALAPFTFTVHLKDQALQRYQDGFLLADIPLGQGSFDLRKMVAMISEVKPEVRFSLELITRDPLKVPCLTAQYWSTLPDVPASDLASALRFVEANEINPLPQISSLTERELVKLEDRFVAESMAYAGQELKL